MIFILDYDLELFGALPIYYNLMSSMSSNKKMKLDYLKKAWENRIISNGKNSPKTIAAKEKYDNLNKF